MSNNKRFRISSQILFVLLACLSIAHLAAAQNPELQQRFAEIKEAAAKNKQALAQYTWVEQVSVILKGEQKKQEHYQVRLGPDGKQQKTPLDPQTQASSGGGGRQHRLKEHVVEKKKEEYKEYADQMKSLIQQYVPPDKEMLARAYQQGNVSLAPEGDAPGVVRIIISDYVKKGDKMTLFIDKANKDLSRLNITSYLSEPKDAVNVEVQFERIPGGPNHVSGETINGVSKQLTIAIQNSNYQKL